MVSEAGSLIDKEYDTAAPIKPKKKDTSIFESKSIKQYVLDARNELPPRQLVGTMNLYEYSEKNNREMGTLLHREDLNGTSPFLGGKRSRDHESIFDDAIVEIREIINGAELEHITSS